MNRLITYTIAALLCWSCQEDNLPPQNIPVISNITISGITDSTALCTFTVTITDAIHSVGINYGTDSSQLTGDFSIDDISGNTFMLPLNNLVDEMVYYYKVYVRDKMFTYIYSEIGEFKTQSSPYGSTFSNGITPARSFRGGDGTQNNPYLIANAQQLKKLVDDVNNGNGYANTYFKMITDIQVTADEWIPIGYGDYNNSNFSFSGNFDGNGHTISGTLKSNQYSIFGFFGLLDGNAIIANLTIAATVRNEGNFASSNASSSTGAIAGYSNSRNVNISYCHITGSVTGGTGYHGSETGGILGAGNAVIQNCDVASQIIGGRAAGNWSRTGGIVGAINTGEITNCTVYASAMVTDCDSLSHDWILTGGIAGGNGAIITNCTNNAAVSGRRLAGGLVGENSGTGIIHTSLNTGNISGDVYMTGGLTGVNLDLSHVYSCCTNRGTVNGQAANANNQIGSGKEIEPCLDGHTKR